MSRLSSPVWGNKPFEITQGFGGINPDTAGMYPGPTYTEPLGWPEGTHVALDIGVPRGTAIYALNSGTVQFAGFNNNFRPYPVYIETDDDPDTIPDESGYVEIYGHLAGNTVSTGQKVKPGKQIGISGEQTIAGTTDKLDGSGPHLHFELRQPGANTSSGFRAIDPTNWLQKKGITVKPETDDENSPTPTLPGGIPGLVEFGQRSLFLIIGVGILLIGLYASFSGGFGKAVKNTVPALKVASAVRNHAHKR